MKTILKFVTGSHSYNLASKNSDFDTLTVFLLEPDEMFSLKRTSYATQKVFDGSDESTVEFSEYLKRLVAGNPSYVQTLFSWQENLLEFDVDVDRLALRERLFSCLVAENVHRSFTGVATRMFREFEQRKTNKSLSEAFRYLFVLNSLLKNGRVDVYLTGNDREYFAALREVGSNSTTLKASFDSVRVECDWMFESAAFGVDKETAFTAANNLSRAVYKNFYRLVL
jgi:predicted nucleotidyltransferase